jgi:hypothetical protein
MNKSLLMKWMWQCVSTDDAWWKEATITPDRQVRPWEMVQPSPFWKNMATLMPIFNASVKFEVREGHITQFWHDYWNQGPLKLQFPSLYEQA